MSSFISAGFSVDRSFDVLRQKHGGLARSVHVDLLVRNGVAGLLHLPHYLPICKGPVLAAISADEFRPRPNYFSSSTRSISPWAESPSALLESRARCELPPIYKRPVRSPFSDIRPKKDAQTREGTVEGGSGRTREYAK